MGEADPENRNWEFESISLQRPVYCEPDGAWRATPSSSRRSKSAAASAARCAVPKHLLSHWPDTGGMVPGGFPATATEIVQEVALV
jgi:hypothetical protein